MNKAAQNVIPAGERMPDVPDQEREPPRQEITPMMMFAQAMAKGIDIEKIREMRSFVEWHEEREAKKAFDRAMTEFRKETIPIIKNKHVKYKNKTGGFTEYDQATLDHVVEIAAPFLGKHGFNYYWNRIPSEQDKQLIEIECILTHEQGHSISTSLDGYPDESGGKNAIQAVISTVSYLERVTLLMLTGLAAKGHDTDGRLPQAPPQTEDGRDEREPINEQELKDLQKLLKKSGADVELFLNWAKIEKLEELPVGKLQTCIKRLHEIEKQNSKG